MGGEGQTCNRRTGLARAGGESRQVAGLRVFLLAACGGRGLHHGGVMRKGNAARLAASLGRENATTCFR